MRASCVTCLSIDRISDMWDGWEVIPRIFAFFSHNRHPLAKTTYLQFTSHQAILRQTAVASVKLAEILWVNYGKEEQNCHKKNHEASEWELFGEWGRGDN